MPVPVLVMVMVMFIMVAMPAAFHHLHHFRPACFAVTRVKHARRKQCDDIQHGRIIPRKPGAPDIEIAGFRHPSESTEQYLHAKGRQNH